MILVGLGICIVMLVIGSLLLNKYDTENIGGTMCVIGGVVGFILLIGAVMTAVDVAKLRVIDERIAMYQEENARIETQIEATVEQYQKYETDIFMDTKPESAITLVALYPELKADTLVQAQIDIYLKNNDTIKELRDQQIKGKVQQWWLYFGGG